MKAALMFLKKIFQKIYHLLKVIFYSFFGKNDKRELVLIKRQMNLMNSRQQVILNRLAFLIDEELENKFRPLDYQFGKKHKPFTDEKKTPVVFITDSKYVVPTFVSISSLLRNCTEGSPKIFVLGIELSQEDISLFNKLENNVKLILTENTLSHLETEHRHVSKAALLKFELANIFSDYNKILYLDSDITIHGDLTSLLNIDVTANYVAAVKDFVGMVRGEHHIKINAESYFNSGVMLLNLEQWRMDNIRGKLLFNKENDKWLQFMDQDALNLTFLGRVKFLSPIFNLMFANMNFYNLDENRFGDFYELGVKEAKNIYASPLIRHYSNVNKPWDNNFSPEFEIWQKEKHLAEYIYDVKL